MASLRTNQTTVITVPVEYLAGWAFLDVNPSADPAATAFGPPRIVERDEMRPTTWSAGAFSTRALKPVLYMPVKKQAHQERFPKMVLSLQILREGGQTLNSPPFIGAEVTFQVHNVWPRHSADAAVRPVSFKAKLDGELRARVEISADTLKEWLGGVSDKPSPFDARINENLLDFKFEFTVEGKPKRGQSRNRLFLYRRKTIVFLPGVFGSQVHAKLPNGRTVGFPDSTFELATRMGAATLAGVAEGQSVGALECDALGHPLIEAEPPVLLHLHGLAYEVFDGLHAAVREMFSPVPDAFRLYTIQLLAYDWRKDLTETAVEIAHKLKVLQDHPTDKTTLRARPDTDDEIAVAGHSTGGLLIRRAMGEPGMQDVISHAFFIDVPFRGAPKVLGVLLTGCDPPFPGGLPSRMIPFVAPESLSSIALTMPIVYHLAPSAALAQRPATVPSRPPGAPHDVEADKREFMEWIVESGLIPNRMVVPNAKALDPVTRGHVAEHADAFHKFWNEFGERERGRVLYESQPDSEATAIHREWFWDRVREDPLLSAGLAHRTTMSSWSPYLAERARAFFETSERIAAAGEWANKAYIFFSLTKDATMTQLNLSIAHKRTYSDRESFVRGEHVSHESFARGVARPPAPHFSERKYGEIPEHVASPQQHELENEISDGVVTYSSWSREPDGNLTATDYKLQWPVFQVFAKGGSVLVRPQGDATVPLSSQLGFGGPANVFKRTLSDGNEDYPEERRSSQRDDKEHFDFRDGPVHKAAANPRQVWKRVLLMLQGHQCDAELDRHADPGKGTHETLQVAASRDGCFP